jgi:hypothetical protein
VRTCKFFISLLIIIFLLSCQENNPTKTTTNGYWKKYLFNYPYYNFVTTGLAVNNKFYCTGLNGISIFTDFETNPTLKYISYISACYDNKPIISNNFTAFFKESTENCIVLSNYIPESGNVRNIYPYRFGNQFKNYKFSFTATKQEFGAINKNRFITTIKSTDSLGVTNNYIVFVDCDFSDGISISNTGYWETPSMLDANISVKSIKNINDKFYISYITESSPRSHYLEISKNGELKEHSNPFENSCYMLTFFEYQGYLCAQKSDYQLIYTSDGKHWQHMAYLEPFISDFKEIDNYLFIYHNDKIYCMGEDINMLKLYQIPTENLAGRTISSINKFNDELVITTSNGIFHKLFTDVMEDKELRREIN